MFRTLFAAVMAACLALSSPALAQTAPLKGDAILKHPIGVLATRVVDLIAAGKFDEVMALRTKSDQADWKKASAAEKKDFGDRMKERAPAPAAFAGLVKSAGVLTIDGNTATLMAEAPAGMLRQTFELEGGQWRASFGPMLLAAQRSPIDTLPAQSRVEKAAILKHPAAAVILQYADLLHADKLDEAIAKLGSSPAQAKWKAEPASEKAASLKFRKSIVPVRAELAKLIETNGVLILEGTTATLNIIRIQPATGQNGRGRSTTVGIPLALENGQWKIAQ